MNYPYQNTLYSLSMKLYNYLWNNRHRFRRNVKIDDGLYKVTSRVIAREFGFKNYRYSGVVVGNAIQHLEDLGLIEIVERRRRICSRVVYIFRFKDRTT